MSVRSHNYSRSPVNKCLHVCVYVNYLLCLYLIGDELLIAATRCLGLLFIPTKTKEESGDIPFFMRFVPVSVYHHQRYLFDRHYF